MTSSDSKYAWHLVQIFLESLRSSCLRSYECLLSSLRSPHVCGLFYQHFQISPQISHVLRFEGWAVNKGWLIIWSLKKLHNALSCRKDLYLFLSSLRFSKSGVRICPVYLSEFTMFEKVNSLIIFVVLTAHHTPI